MLITLLVGLPARTIHLAARRLTFCPARATGDRSCQCACSSSPQSHLLPRRRLGKQAGALSPARIGSRQPEVYAAQCRRCSRANRTGRRLEEPLSGSRFAAECSHSSRLAFPTTWRSIEPSNLLTLLSRAAQRSMSDRIKGDAT